MENLKIYQKINDLKLEIKPIEKGSTNPYYNSRYFDINSLLAEVEPLLEKQNLLLLQPIENGRVKSVIFDLDSGESLTSELALPENIDPQKIGSAITYYRRYTLQSLLALQAEDDDGNAASGNKPLTPKKVIENGKPIKQSDKAPDKKWLNVMDKDQHFTREWLNVIDGVKKGSIGSVADVRKVYAVSKAVEAKIDELLQPN